ncbi:hypothetical protein L5515_003009 [Caenorhabditis briggsae]|uniref:Uncharacterized protein n=1 Tax=Caenorhabditis briggsae TaxID=6238 RepID=A0AAE9J9R5_CAEBR|nr:hypothetical protein L5515_003009 [Caenorhabditis briggsae]
MPPNKRKNKKKVPKPKKSSGFEFLKPTVPKTILSPNGQANMEGQEACLHLFTMVVCGINWKMRMFQDKDGTASIQHKLMEVLVKYTNWPQPFKIALSVVQRDIATLQKLPSYPPNPSENVSKTLLENHDSLEMIPTQKYYKICNEYTLAPYDPGVAESTVWETQLYLITGWMMMFLQSEWRANEQVCEKLCEAMMDRVPESEKMNHVKKFEKMVGSLKRHNKPCVPEKPNSLPLPTTPITRLGPNEELIMEGSEAVFHTCTLLLCGINWKRISENFDELEYYNFRNTLYEIVTKYLEPGVANPVKYHEVVKNLLPLQKGEWYKHLPKEDLNETLLEHLDSFDEIPAQKLRDMCLKFGVREPLEPPNESGNYLVWNARKHLLKSWFELLFYDQPLFREVLNVAIQNRSPCKCCQESQQLKHQETDAQLVANNNQSIIYATTPITTINEEGEKVMSVHEAVFFTVISVVCGINWNEIEDEERKEAFKEDLLAILEGYLDLENGTSISLRDVLKNIIQLKQDPFYEKLVKTKVSEALLEDRRQNEWVAPPNYVEAFRKFGLSNLGATPNEFHTRCLMMGWKEGNCRMRFARMFCGDCHRIDVLVISNIWMRLWVTSVWMISNHSRQPGKLKIYQFYFIFKQRFNTPVISGTQQDAFF